MILKIFKSNSPLSGLLTLLFLGALWFNTFQENLTPTFLDFGAFYHFKSYFLSLPSWTLNLFSVLIIILTATILNNTVNKDEFFEKNTFLPSLLYVLLTSILIEFNRFNPIIISNLFLVLFLRWSFKIRRQQDARQIIFNSSFLLSCATLFFPIYSPFLLSPIVLLIVFRPFVWREWILSLLGLLIPFAFYAYLMWFSDVPFESNTYCKSLFHLLNLNFDIQTKHYLFIIIYGALTFIAFFVVNRKMNSSSLRLRMLMRFLAYNYFVALLLSFALYFKSDLFLIIAALPLTIFFSYYFYYTKAFWGNLYFYLLIGTIIYSVYFV